MRIDNNGGCGVPLCGVDLGPNCQSSVDPLMTFHSTLLLTFWKAPRQSEDRSTQPGSLWGAWMPAMQTFHPTRTTRQIVALEVSTPPQHVSPGMLNIILTLVSFF